MDDATRSMHGNERGAEFLLLYLTREEVHYLARRLRWQLGRVLADTDLFTEARFSSDSDDERAIYTAALEEFRNESDTIARVLGEFRAAWRRPSVTRDS